MGGVEGEVAGDAENVGGLLVAEAQGGDGADQQPMRHDQNVTVPYGEVLGDDKGFAGSVGERAEAFSAGQRGVWLAGALLTPGKVFGRVLGRSTPTDTVWGSPFVEGRDRLG